MSDTRETTTPPPADEAVWERWSKKRVFVRALEGTYGELVHELFSQPRVYKSKDWKWKGGPQTYLGLLVEDFPNMLMLVGPHTALGNIPRSIEYAVEWVSGLMKHLHDNRITRIECRSEGVADWTNHVRALGEGLLSNEIDSWMTGINRNIEGKNTRIVARYSGSAPAYRARCDAIAAAGYRELQFG